MWWRTSNCSLLLIYRPRRDKRLSWPGWLTYSGLITHINGHPSATGRAQNRESSPARDRRSTAEPRREGVSKITKQKKHESRTQACRHTFTSRQWNQELTAHATHIQNIEQAQSQLSACCQEGSLAQWWGFMCKCCNKINENIWFILLQVWFYVQ